MIIVAFVILGNYDVDTYKYNIKSGKIPESFDGFRIAQVSDLHNAEFDKYNSTILAPIFHSQPDIIVITGDMIDSRRTDFDVAISFARKAVNTAPVYYDTGLTSDMTPRCGTLDGELKKTVGEDEIPQKSSEANFEADGYQNATGITKEVNINGEWVIFKKFDTYGNSLDGLKYCHYIKGRLNNAAVDSEIIVLSEYADVTFNDVYAPLLSSAYPADTKGYILHNRVDTDK